MHKYLLSYAVRTEHDLNTMFVPFEARNDAHADIKAKSLLLDISETAGMYGYTVEKL